MKTLADTVHIERRFARSARLDADLRGSPPLVGYILQASTRVALKAMVEQQADSRQGAFTWTGPYGGGKSCAALLVGNLVGGEPENRRIAEELAGPELVEAFAKAFPPDVRPWAVVALTGSRNNLRQAIAAAASQALAWSDGEARRAASSDAALVVALETSGQRQGVLLLLDELGKFLEHAVAEGGDIHLLQDLAERSARSHGRLVVIGILHQAFEQYAGRLSREARQEWTKVQGRFQDISFLAGADETVALLGRAIVAKDRPLAADLAERVAAAVGDRRPTDQPALAAALADAWPLNPVTALLLGPVSRQRFAQNERSVFGFLSSSEPNGFSAFLRSQGDKSTAAYGPELLWDYLSSNFGMALASGRDGARFSLAFEAIDRAAAKGGELHVNLTKAAAVIELFRNGSGLAVSTAFLEAAMPAATRAAVAGAINDLVEWAVLMRQPRLGGFAMFAGSDFDLEKAIEGARTLPSTDAMLGLPNEVGLGFAVAKRHYFRTGALRAFEILVQLIGIEDKPTDIATRLAARHLRSSGLLVLAVSDSTLQRTELARKATAMAGALHKAGVIAAVASSDDSLRLREGAMELFALARVAKEHHQLQGDRIARREIAARRSACLDAIQLDLSTALGSASWWLGPDIAKPRTGSLAIISTALADAAYPQAPILRSELVQRDRPSSNAMAAVRDLAHAMVTAPREAALGLKGYPAEMGLYLTAVKPFGLHRLGAAGAHGFHAPDTSHEGHSLLPVWDVMSAAPDMQLDAVYRTWSARPFGLKRGVMPILALANILARRDQLAIYVDGLFQTELDTFFVDRMLQDPPAIRLKATDRSIEQTGLLRSLTVRLDLGGEPSALIVAQALFQRCRALPPYAQRTGTLSETIRLVRDAILQADDPEALLFKTLASMDLGEDPGLRIVGAIAEAEEAYSCLLRTLKRALAQSIGTDPDSFAGVDDRADAIRGLTSDLRFEAFAMRVAAFERGEGDLEGLAGLIAHKPPRSWSDRDRDQALFDIARFGRRFREAEAIAMVRERRSQTEALALVVGLDPKTPALLTSFELTETERAEANALAGRLLTALEHDPADQNVCLAALARAVAKLASARELEAL